MLQIAICDDSQACIAEIYNYTESYFQQHHISASIDTFSSAENLLEKDCSIYDILLLDVRMESIDGLAAGKQVRQINSKAIIVYISEMIEYAPMAYEVQAFRYLLKSNLANAYSRCFDEIIEELQRQKATFPIKTDLGNYYVPIKDILYIESRKRLVTFHLSKETSVIRQEFECYGKLTDLEHTLSPYGFVLLQRGFLVNMERILFISKTQATLDSGLTIPVSEKNHNEIIRQYNLWKGVVGWKK